MLIVRYTNHNILSVKILYASPCWENASQLYLSYIFHYSVGHNKVETKGKYFFSCYQIKSFVFFKKTKHSDKISGK